MSKKSQDKVALIIPDCVPTTTEVLTRDGWVPISKVQIGDYVMVSTAYQELYFDKVKALVPTHEAKIYRFKRGSVTFDSTINHRHLSPLHESKERTTAELLDKAAAVLACSGIKRDGTSLLTEDLGYLLGFCLGDGTRDTDNWKISVTKSRKTKALQKLVDQDIITHNINRVGTEVRHLYRVRAPYTRILDEFVGKKKEINWSKFLKLDEDGLISIRNGWQDSDGALRADRPSLFLSSVRPDHIKLWQTINHLTGRNTTWGVPTSNKNSTFPSDKPLYNSCTSENTRQAWNGKFIPSSIATTEVTCINVDTGFFLARQNNNITITGNCHIPFHDERAYNLMITVAKDVNPDEIVILGDYADFYAASTHDKYPGLNVDLVDEVDAVNEKLDELDKLFPKAKKVFLEGNHEWRLARYISKKAPELFGISDVKRLFKLNKRPKWTFVPYGPQQKYQVAASKLWARHEPLGGSNYAARSSVVKAGCSLIFGHIHNIQENQVVMLDDSNHRGICPGWLGDKNHPVMSYVKGHHQWSLGFSLVDILEDGTFFNNTVHIIDYKCTYGNWIYEG